MTDNSSIKITDKDINDFQEIYRKRFGHKLKRPTAIHKLYLLLRQMHAVYRPITKQEAARLCKKYEDENEERISQHAPDN